jgi:hypothetical protein
MGKASLVLFNNVVRAYIGAVVVFLALVGRYARSLACAARITLCRGHDGGQVARGVR